MNGVKMTITPRSDKIKEARKAQKITQAAAAKAANITAAYMCLLENGKQKVVSPEVAEAIAVALETDPDLLFENYRPPQEEKKNRLTPEEKELLAAEYIGWVKQIAWEETQKYYDMEYDEAFSAALLAFAECLNTYEKGPGNIRSWISRAIKNRAISDYRKRCATKRRAALYHIDDTVKGKDGKETSCHERVGSAFNLEKHVILREECREAPRNLPPSTKLRLRDYIERAELTDV